MGSLFQQRVGLQRWWVPLGALAWALASAWLGLHHGELNNNPHGRYLYAVKDVPVPPLQRPRRMVVVVVDGLRADAAVATRTGRWFARHGACWPTRATLPSMSKPLYAAMSTGVEQDRSGVRTNQFSAPSPAQDVWTVARSQGRRVVGMGDTPWWQGLFPNGFDAWQSPPPDLTGAAPTADMVLWHPTTVDHAGHAHGAQSAQYAAAVAQVDQTLQPLLAALDVDQDVLVFTADHGHRDVGGHGGDQREVVQVLTCAAGMGLVPGAHPGPLLTTTVAPLLALLAGVPFPANMRADAQLANVWPALRWDAARVKERQQAAGRFVHAEQSAAALLDPSAHSFADWGDAVRLRRQQWFWGGAAVSWVLVALGVGRRKHAVAVAVWLAANATLTVAVFHAWSGALDLSAVDEKAPFVGRCLVAAAAVQGALFLAAYSLLKQDPRRMVAWPGACAVWGSLMLAWHAWVLGLPMTPPLPGPLLMFLPLPLCAWVGWWAGTVAVMHVAVFRGQRGKAPISD